MKLGPFRRSSRQSGYVLLVLMFLMALLVIAALASAPAVATQLKRDREEEMVHRGAQYARAIKRYVKKFGRYPTSLEQLEGTNNLRFLRKRYADPMAKDGKWRLLYATDVKFPNAQRGAGLGTPAAQLAAQSGQSPSAFGGPAGQSLVQPGLGLGTSPGGLSSPGLSSPGGLTGGLSTGPGGLSTSPGGLSSSPGGLSSSPTAQGATPGVTAAGTAGQPVFGAGAIVGVASVSEKEGLKEFNQKTHYNEWQFVYDYNSDSGALIRGPYTGKTFSSGGKPLGGQPSSLDPHSIAPSTFGLQPSTLGSPSSTPRQ